MNLVIGRNSIIEAIKNKREIDTIFIKSGEKDEKIKFIISLAKQNKILLKEVDKKKLDSMAQGDNHQGVIGLISEYKYYELNDLISDIQDKNNKNEKSFIVILDKIEDPHNFGAIVRSSYLAKADAIIIQNRRSAQVTQVVEKTSAGATSYMKIIRVNNLNDTIEKLKKAGIWIYALDMGKSYYYEVDLTGNIAIIVGNEGNGVSQLVKKNSDFVISIPIDGKIDSLNASVAASIVMFDVVRQKMIKK